MFRRRALSVLRKSPVVAPLPHPDLDVMIRQIAEWDTDEYAAFVTFTAFLWNQIRQRRLEQRLAEDSDT